jgi:hypothetical protein
VRRKGGTVHFKGSLGPTKRRRVIAIQVKAGKGWKVLARAQTSKRSTFTCARSLKRGHAYTFRAQTSAYPGLLGGTSPIVQLRK